MSDIPKPSLLGGLIKRSKSTATRMTDEKAGMLSRKCPNCSAARPADADIKRCDFCGFQFLSDAVGTHTKDSPEED